MIHDETLFDNSTPARIIYSPPPPQPPGPFRSNYIRTLFPVHKKTGRERNRLVFLLIFLAKSRRSGFKDGTGFDIWRGRHKGAFQTKEKAQIQYFSVIYLLISKRIQFLFAIAARSGVLCDARYVFFGDYPFNVSFKRDGVLEFFK